MLIQSDVKAECMQTPSQQPEPELQQSGCSLYLFMFLQYNHHDDRFKASFCAGVLSRIEFVLFV